VTQNYLVGEASLLLARLQEVAVAPSSVRAVASLRREAEQSPPRELATVLTRTMELTDAICWDSLGRGDVAAFLRQAATGAELWRFGDCAGLFEDSC
jgi:hypothetical protein